MPICENRYEAKVFSMSVACFDCSHRLQYLVAKGAILRKGQRIKTKVRSAISE